jgi:hypothetical protein
MIIKTTGNVTLSKDAGEDGEFRVTVNHGLNDWDKVQHVSTFLYCPSDLVGAVACFADQADLPWTVKVN